MSERCSIDAGVLGMIADGRVATIAALQPGSAVIALVRSLLLVMAMVNLLDRLGGRDGLAIVVSGLVSRLCADPRFAHKFDHPRAQYEEYILDYAAVLLDGDRAPGLDHDLAAVHLRLQFGEEALTMFLQYLTDTLAAAGVGISLSRQILMQIACASWPQIR